MDVPSRQDSYSKWKAGEIQIVVATKAFGLSIDKGDVRNVIVPESIMSWVQELGRAGRDGKQACATILYRKSNISHANAWVWRIKRDVMKFLRNFPSLGSTLKHI